MKLSVDIDINKASPVVWDIICDIENAKDRISGITGIVILNKPDAGIEGLKWEETRVMFGKEAKETMWITDVIEGRSYMTRAESHGSIYETKMEVIEKDQGCHLFMEFNGIPQTMGAKIMIGLMGFMFKGATEKALMKDLEDIKQAAEAMA